MLRKVRIKYESCRSIHYSPLIALNSCIVFERMHIAMVCRLRTIMLINLFKYFVLDIMISESLFMDIQCAIACEMCYSKYI
jgi:hypothetical protein